MAWAVISYLFFGYSYDLHLQCGIQFHASLVKTNRGTKGFPVLVGTQAEKVTMKKGLFLLLMLVSVTAFAQKSVTKFLGIPVDGYKSEMIQKLKAKGYKYNSTTEYLEGEFNGMDVVIAVVTNNNKVYRIFIAEEYSVDESQIKIRFNNLCQQFVNNSKYVTLKDFSIPESEDISHEMLVHNKSYQAAFYQIHSDDDTDEDILNRTVWFTIQEQYGKYRILMYYDNVWNQANGDDL